MTRICGHRVVLIAAGVLLSMAVALSTSPQPCIAIPSVADGEQLDSADAGEADNAGDPALFQAHTAFYDLKSSQMHAEYWRRQLLQFVQPSLHGNWYIMAVGGQHMREISAFLCQMLDETYRRTAPDHASAGELGCSGMWGSINATVQFYFAVPAVVQKWTPSDEERPAVVFFDSAGVDLLHTMPHSKWKYYEHWSKFKENLRGALEHVQAANIPAVYVTTSAVCEAKFDAEHKWAARYCREQSDTLRKACEHELGDHVSRLHMDAPCFHACRSEHAVAQLSQSELSLLSGFRNVEVVNAYALTVHQCWATAEGDGIHFRPLVPSIMTQVLHRLRSVIEAHNIDSQ
ncbi:hypothetical protein PTSG_02625 [Salpingoeca rosetta]|uniref:SGNH domain-containing protein n=1 Tax=Salpingoeca rosetta (strain ATCC 50818 / BSB-021) TaxID=946362 RepID=F2U2U5_SALR5|nr:uncharacterized protein PTSG_02625 [Salpingoeca rosetta]EGD81939.1 hypothetical protein PTSG_02625 [Salpingoeca rosetta]|eukprot:XP_004996122.1 hypothetical protein PTSG_02625 [Salpingoeca rosetta]